MNIIFAILIAIIIILLLVILVADCVRLRRKQKEKIFDKVIGKVSSLLSSKIDVVMDQHKTGPWYLTVYTKDSNYPIWISNNTIRSVHPDPEHCKIIIKQFNYEDMVIEHVISYELCSGSDLCDYDM